jgi:hypothetical protein
MGRCVVYVVFFCLVMLIDWDMWVDLHEGCEECTFISDRLSPECLESALYEFKLDDTVVSIQLYSYL